MRLNFNRDAKPTCGDEVIFPALNIRRKVEVNKLTTVDPHLRKVETCSSPAA